MCATRTRKQGLVPSASVSGVPLSIVFNAARMSRDVAIAENVRVISSVGLPPNNF